MKKYLGVSFLVLLIFVANISAKKLKKKSTGKSLSNNKLPLAVVYKGPAGCDNCTQAIVDSLTNYFEIVIAGPNENLSIKDALDLHPVVYLQPGGGDDMDVAWNDVGKYTDVIRKYVSNGGNYVGICMGAYLAGVFTLKDDSLAGFNLLEESGSFADSYIETKGADTQDSGEIALNITWNGEEKEIFYQLGPYFSHPTNTKAKIVATYSNGEVAALITPFNKGRVGVVGPHPEATEDWVSQWGISPVNDLFAQFVKDTFSRN